MYLNNIDWILRKTIEVIEDATVFNEKKIKLPIYNFETCSLGNYCSRNRTINAITQPNHVRLILNSSLFTYTSSVYVCKGDKTRRG